MPRILHKLLAHKPDPNTSILVVGTFNPDTPENNADFFYGRPQNFLWKLLPLSFGEDSLKTAPLDAKKQFMKQFNVDFMDLIAEVDVAIPNNYNDDYIDSRVIAWHDAIKVMRQLPHLKKVCFTRKTFADIPNIKSALAVIEAYCHAENLLFQCLPTPTRGYTAAKQAVWTDFFGQ
jgi:G:T/U-mismatch repair DNA glycosylase